MPNFLAQVGNAELFENVGGTLRLFATAKTLTDTSITVTSTSEDIRQGEGSKLVDKFYGSPGMDINLTDAMFNTKYIAGLVGKQIQSQGSEKNIDKRATFVYDKQDKKIKLKLSKEPKPLGIACGLDQHIIVWYKRNSCKNNSMYAAEIKQEETSSFFVRADGGEFSGVYGDGSKVYDDYCIYTMQESTSAKTVLLGANSFPREFVLTITTNLYAGDSTSHPESGSKVGQVRITVPRFKLDGNFDLSAQLNSSTPISIKGSALYSQECIPGCKSKGIFAEITEIIHEEKDTNFTLLIKDFDTYQNIKNWVIGEEIQVYKRESSGEISQVDSSELTWGGTVWDCVGDEQDLVDLNGKIRQLPIYNGILVVVYKGKAQEFVLSGGFAREKPVSRTEITVCPYLFVNS